MVLDKTQSFGTSKKVAAWLKKKGLPVRVSTCPGMHHYKVMSIDDTTLVLGSANWTKAAFTQNDDCYIILQNLKPKHRKKMDQLWTKLIIQSRPL